MMNAKERIILALDVDNFDQARAIVDEFSGHVGMFKVGKQIFTGCGPKIVDFIKSRGAGVFLDLKYHDIPNTVSKAGIEAMKLHVDLFNVHASGGFTMMRETRDAVAEASVKLGVERPRIIAVTVLTSIDDAELARMGLHLSAADLTRHLALLTKEAGLDGVVASGHEIEMIRELCGDDFWIVTPGVRITDKKDDQKRTVGPGEAIRRGATFVVLGRTVLGTEHPKETLKRVEDEIGNALS
jgi:orotidine-5'-phosphate decarboxylase